MFVSVWSRLRSYETFFALDYDVRHSLHHPRHPPVVERRRRIPKLTAGKPVPWIARLTRRVRLRSLQRPAMAPSRRTARGVASTAIVAAKTRRALRRAEIILCSLTQLAGASSQCGAPGHGPSRPRSKSIRIAVRMTQIQGRMAFFRRSGRQRGRSLLPRIFTPERLSPFARPGILSRLELLVSWKHPILRAFLSWLVLSGCLSLEAIAIHKVGLEPRMGLTRNERLAELFGDFDREAPGARRRGARDGRGAVPGGIWPRRSRPEDADRSGHGLPHRLLRQADDRGGDPHAGRGGEGRPRQAGGEVPPRDARLGGKGHRPQPAPSHRRHPGHLRGAQGAGGRSHRHWTRCSSSPAGSGSTRRPEPGSPTAIRATTSWGC